MIVNYSRSEMLQIWRRCAGLEPSASSCTVERFDGIDVDTRLEGLMRLWYLALLDEGDINLAGAPADATELVTPLPPGDDSRIATLICAPAVRRLCTIRLSGWKRPATVTDRRNDLYGTALQDNRYSRAGAVTPITWFDGDGTVYATPAGPETTVVSATAYIDNGTDSYRLDERALATIHAFLKQTSTPLTL